MLFFLESWSILNGGCSAVYKSSSWKSKVMLGKWQEIAPTLCDMSCVGVDGSDSHHPERVAPGHGEHRHLFTSITVLITGMPTCPHVGASWGQSLQTIRHTNIESACGINERTLWNMVPAPATGCITADRAILQSVSRYTAPGLPCSCSASDTKNIGEKYDQFGERGEMWS